MWRVIVTWTHNDFSSAFFANSQSKTNGFQSVGEECQKRESGEKNKRRRVGGVLFEGGPLGEPIMMALKHSAIGSERMLLSVTHVQNTLQFSEDLMMRRAFEEVGVEPLIAELHRAGGWHRASLSPEGRARIRQLMRDYADPPGYVDTSVFRAAFVDPPISRPNGTVKQLTHAQSS